MIKVVKNTLKEEVVYRIELLQQSFEEIKNYNKDDRFRFDEAILTYELAVYENVLKMIEHFERLDFVTKIEKEKYTPYKCEKTGTPLLIGDKCFEIDNGLKKEGTLVFDEHFNKYLLKNEYGNNIHFFKIEKM